jgi:hypothetical protein
MIKKRLKTIVYTWLKTSRGNIVLKRQSKIKISYLGINSQTDTTYAVLYFVLCMCFRSVFAFYVTSKALLFCDGSSAFSDVSNFFSILNIVCIFCLSNSRAIHAIRVKIPRVSTELQKHARFSPNPTRVDRTVYQHGKCFIFVKYCYNLVPSIL